MIGSQMFPQSCLFVVLSMMNIVNIMMMMMMMMINDDMSFGF